MTEGLLKYGEHGFTNVLVDLTHLRALAVALICANLNWKKTPKLVATLKTRCLLQFLASPAEDSSALSDIPV